MITDSLERIEYCVSRKNFLFFVTCIVVIISMCVITISTITKDYIQIMIFNYYMDRLEVETKISKEIMTKAEAMKWIQSKGY